MSFLVLIFFLDFKALKVDYYSVGSSDYISFFKVAEYLGAKKFSYGFKVCSHTVFLDIKKGYLILDGKILKNVSFFKKDGSIWIDADKFAYILSKIYSYTFFWDKGLKVFLLTRSPDNTEIKYKVFGKDSLYLWIQTSSQCYVDFVGLNEIRIGVKNGVKRYWGYNEVRKGLLLGFKVFYRNKNLFISVFLYPSVKSYRKFVYKNGLFLKFYSSKIFFAKVSRKKEKDKIKKAKPGKKRRWVIVLDPGHGGRDPGAIGWGGLKEKDIVLKLAIILKKMIKKEIKNAEVYLTREKDVFVPLSERARFANKVGADLFISLHCNAHRKRVKESMGVETYILSEAKTSWERAVAIYENSALKYEIGNQNLPNDLVNWILTDMAQVKYLEESSELAECIQLSLVRNMLSRDRGVKQAGFYVLNGVYAPAVLIEVGFITSLEDAKKLANDKYLRKIARAILEGIKKYLQRYAN